MRYSIRTVTPLSEIDAVVSLEDAKLWLRVELDDEDDLIEALVLAAQDAVERHCSRLLTPREIEVSYASFPLAADDYAFALPREPVNAIASIQYIDSDGVAAELDEADWRWAEFEPLLVRPPYDGAWPSAYAEAGSVRVTFEGGYEEGLCPPSLIQAVKLLLTHLYENRSGGGEDLPAGVVALCRPYRRVLL